ncbi:MAG TPA: GMP synthase (glutamine-hydrolyzing), partial [Dehalococcoidia bacterium]|nr:GMP synthase (glutamine-hydrolyzing) [Dehalococcoidia bacterium]
IGDDRGRLGIQFHPEVVHTPEGKNVIRNFLYKICGCDQSWTPGNFVAETVESIRDQVGDGRVICGLSG